MKTHLILCVAVLLALGTAAVGTAESFNPEEPAFLTPMPENTDFFAPGTITPGVLYFAEQNRDYRAVFTASESGIYYFYIRNAQKPGVWHTHFGFFDQYERAVEDLPRDVAVEGIAPRIEQFELKAGSEYHINVTGHETDFFFGVCSPSQHAGELSDFEVIQEPACVTPGYKAQRCMLCGGEANREEIPAAGHVEGEQQVLRVPDCLTKGSKGVKCVVCGALLSETELPLGDHTPAAWADLKPVTCTADGLRVQRCAVCGKTLDTETIPAFGHSPMEWEITREASCNQSGMREIKCAICGASLEREEIPALGHSYSNWEVSREASAYEEGEKIRRCIHCGDTQTETIKRVLKVMRVEY